jgi:hypothetical protein
MRHGHLAGFRMRFWNLQSRGARALQVKLESFGSSATQAEALLPAHSSKTFLVIGRPTELA